MGSEDGKMGREGRGGGRKSGFRDRAFAVGGAFSVDDGVVIGCHGSCPSGMSSGGSAGLGEVLQVLVVSVDLNRMCSSLDIDPPFLKPLNHRQ